MPPLHQFHRALGRRLLHQGINHALEPGNGTGFFLQQEVTWFSDAIKGYADQIRGILGHG